jgi:hypothetical protein
MSIQFSPTAGSPATVLKTKMIFARSFELGSK